MTFELFTSQQTKVAYLDITYYLGDVWKIDRASTALPEDTIEAIEDYAQTATLGSASPFWGPLEALRGAVRIALRDQVSDSVFLLREHLRSEWVVTNGSEE